MSSTNNSANLFNTVMNNITLFKDQNQMPYAVVKMGSNQQIVNIDDGDFGDWLRIACREITKKLPSRYEILNLIQNFHSEASVNGKVYHLFNRVAIYNDDFWYYVGNPEMQAIKINNRGWEGASLPILFKKSDLFLPQVVPEKGGNYSRLLNFVNIYDKNLQLLFLVSVASLLIPEIQYPAMVFYGNEGSAKTTVVNMIRRLIDPSKARPSVMTGKVDDMCIQLSKSHLVAYDNLDTLSKTQSDILCQAITGGSLEKRSLYTNANTFLLNFKGALLLNGISNVVTRADLLDRSLLFELKRINDSNRISETDFWNKFDTELPKILGGAFDVISDAMKIYPDLTLDKTFRLGAFTQWGAALAIAMGYSQDDFLTAYEDNRKIASERAVSGDPLAETVRMMMAEIPEWSGYIGELYKCLKDIAEDNGISKMGFPKGSNYLAAALKKCEVILKSEGIEFIIGDKTRNGKEVLVVNNYYSN